MHILVTGATGFIGSRLVQVLQSKPDVKMTAIVRRPVDLAAARVVEIAELNANTDCSVAVKNQHVIIHCAARAHIMKDESVDPLSEYRRINVEATLNLARQAAEAGVKRFIFISSIKVNGENTRTDECFHADAPAFPQDAYAISKWEAEQGLWKLQSATKMEVVIIRPPLVYGPNALGNFGLLRRWVEKGIPLPLAAIHNRRSLIALDNLVDLIMSCIDHPAAANQLFLVSDGQDLSTTELLRAVAVAAGKSSRLFPLPSQLLMLAATLLGKKAVAQRLLGSLQVDISKTRDLLGWEPPISVQEGLRRCFQTSRE